MNINNGIRDSYVGENGVFHVSQRATVLVGEAYQSFDTRGSGYFNHDFGGSAFGIGYSKASGPNISFDFGGSFLIGGRLGVTLTFK